MPPLTKYHPATFLELTKWSTLSRNEIRPFFARFGIEPLGRKFPMIRVYEHLLGVSPKNDLEEDMLGRGLVRVTKVAEWFGISGDVLLTALRAADHNYPPLYAFGPKRNLLLKAQIEQLLASPRNAWECLTPIDGHALPASRLARHLNVSQAHIDAVLAKKTDLPARIISQGRVQYIVSDVAHRLAASTAEEAGKPRKTMRVDQMTESTSAAKLPTSGSAPLGLFADTAKRAISEPQQPFFCTGSGVDAR